MIKNIILDFGHGGLTEEGKYTTAPSKMFKFPDGVIAYEGVLNRQIGGLIRLKLEEENTYNVVCTVKEKDSTDLPLRDRVEINNSYNKEDTIFISIHCNAGGGTGFEIFTSTGQTKSDILAEEIANSVEDLYETVELRLRYDLSDGDKDKESDFYVLRKTKGVAVLIECGFFDNRNNFDLLQDPGFQCILANNIAEGILKYIINENQI